MNSADSQEWPVKAQAMIPVSHSLLNDMGANYPEGPRDPRFERWGVFWWERRRQDLVNALVSPLWWLGRAGSGASWLGVELTNVLYRLFRVNAIMVHDSPEDDDDD